MPEARAELTSLLVSAASDGLAPQLGAESLRYALAGLLVTTAIASMLRNIVLREVRRGFRSA